MLKNFIAKRLLSSSLSRFVKASIERNGKVVYVEEASKDPLRFPAIWLRDNCQCKSCFSQKTQSRIIDYSKFSVDVKAENVEVCYASLLRPSKTTYFHFQITDKILNVNWSDNHKSIHHIDWLTDRTFTKQKQEQYLRDFYRPPYKLWDKSMYKDVAKYYEYNDIINDDRGEFLNLTFS